ncbi:MAG: Ig domain-containing protein [Candidatus Microsaccharimonas sp.]
MALQGDNVNRLSSSPDVALNNPANNQVLTYDSLTGKWKNAVSPSAPVSSVAGKTGAVTIGVTDITASGVPGVNTYLRGDGVWTTLGNDTESPEAPTVTTTNLETITQGVVFNQTLVATGSVPIVWAIVGGSLPAGLVLNQATGVIDGTPTSATAYAFTVRATNSVGFDDQSYGDTVAATPVVPTITTTVLSGMTQGITFSQTLQSTGTVPMTFTVSAGSIPAGLNLSSTGVLSGTPTASGAYNFTITATNTAGTDTQVFTGTVASTSTSVVTSDSFNRANAADVVGSQTDIADGGSPTAWQSAVSGVWSISNNTLIANANVSGGAYVAVSTSDYEVSAVITEMTNLTGSNLWSIDGRRNQLPAAGASQYRLRVVSNGTVSLNKMVSGTETTLWTSGAGLASVGKRLGLRMMGSTISVMLDGTLQQSISDTSIATSAYAGFSRLNQGTGAWDSFRVQVPSGTAAVAPIITTSTLNTTTQGAAFSQTMKADGTAPITWSITTGSLPAGLSLNANTGIISGTPTTAGDYSFTIAANNSAGGDRTDMDGTVLASASSAPVITTTELNTLTVGKSFSQTIGATGSSTGRTWSVSSGTLPAGLTLKSSTGIISGTPTTAGSYSFVLTLTNSSGSDTQSFSGSVLSAATGNVPTRVESYGPNGSHYPERTKWVGDTSGWASSVEVAASWSAIGTAITNATNNFPNGDCLIKVQPGTLPGNGAGSTSNPVLQNIGSRTRARRIVVAPRDGIWSVIFSGSPAFNNVNGVAFIGFQLLERGEALARAPTAGPGGQSVNIRNTADFAWAWSKVNTINISSNSTINGITVTGGIELCEVVRPTSIADDADSWAIRNAEGRTYAVDGVKLRGCYVAPTQRIDPGVHCDTLQLSAGLYHDHIEFEDTVIWGSTNAAVIGSGNGNEADGGSRYGELDHSMLVGTNRTLYRYPKIEGAGTINQPVGFNAEAPLWTAINQTYLFGKNMPVWATVSNSYGTNSPAYPTTTVSGSWTIDSSLAPNAAWFDARVPKPTDSYLESIWSW